MRREPPKMTLSPFSDHQTLRDAGYTKEDPYAELRQRTYRPGPESQLAEQYPKRAHPERSTESAPRVWSTTLQNLSPASQVDPLHSSEEQFSATLAEIRQTRSELKLLAETVRSLQQTPQLAITHSHSSTSDPLMPAQFPTSPLDHRYVPPPSAELDRNEVSECDEVDWPDPPPWPEPEEPQSVSGAPIMGILEKLMSELQVLKQAASHPSRPLAVPSASLPVMDSRPSDPQTSRMHLGRSSQRQSLHSQPPLRAVPAYESEQYESNLQGEHAAISQPYLQRRAQPRTLLDLRHHTVPLSEPTY